MAVDAALAVYGIEVISMTRVLIVDDDSAIREVLREALEEEGYVVDEATDGITCLAALRASPEGMVVLLDQLMPNLDGLGVLRALRAEPALASRHTFILLTARTRVSTPVGDDPNTLLVSLVRKPFELEALLQAVEQAASRLDARRD
jgi:CheY-like chemotaxis protein